MTSKLFHVEYKLITKQCVCNLKFFFSFLFFLPSRTHLRATRLNPIYQTVSQATPMYHRLFTFSLNKSLGRRVIQRIYNASAAINRWNFAQTKQNGFFFSSSISCSLNPRSIRLPKNFAFQFPLTHSWSKFNSQQGAMEEQNGSLISSANIYFGSGRENKGKKKEIFF